MLCYVTITWAGPLKLVGCWIVKVQHESETHNSLVAQWLELLVQFQVVWGLIPCEVILLFGYMSQHMDLMVSMLSMLVGRCRLLVPIGTSC